jgi:hypothetical protein
VGSGGTDDPDAAGGLPSRDRPDGWRSRVGRALAVAYAAVGVALHVVLGVFFVLGYWSRPWWPITLIMLAWTAMWVPVVRLSRSRPGAVLFVVFAAEVVAPLVLAAIADAAGWI